MADRPCSYARCSLVPLPEYQSLMLPLLRRLADGASHSVAELREQLAAEFGIIDDERTQLLPSGRARLFDNRVAWARTNLGQAGALEATVRGHVRITDRGRAIVSENP